MTTLTGKLIRTDSVDVPPEYQREESLVSPEDPLYRSIKINGVLDHINVLALSNGRYGLIKGGRRLDIAKTLGLHTIPAIVDELPAGVEPREYQDRLRFILDEHSQDLFPSQRAMLIKKLMSMFNMNQKDVAEYLGVDPGSITLWLKIDNYAPEIVKAIDTGELNLHKARAFDDVQLKAQPRIYRKMRKQFEQLNGRQLQKLIGSRYAPRTKASGKKQPKRRKKLTRSDKELLARDLTLKETELSDGKEELIMLNREITLATPVIRAILRNEDLVAKLPEEVVPEFERFSEVYC